MKKENQNSKIEEKALRILEDLLDGFKKIKTHFKREDKVPLFDGFFNLLNQNGEILKRFDVQVKGSANLSKLERGPNKGKIKYGFDVDVLDAVRKKVTENPTFYFVVDIKTHSIYYKLLTTDFLVSLNYLGSNSESVNYYFCDSDKLDDENSFIKELLSIHEKSLNQAVFKSTEEIKTIQTAMNEFYRKTFDIDFIIKSIWPNLWKFGLKTSSSMKANIRDVNTGSSLGSKCSAFAIYPILFGDDKKEISDYYPSQDNLFVSLDFTNGLSSEKYLNDCLTKIVSLYFNELFDYIRYLPTICLNEIVFSYLDQLSNYDKNLSSTDYFKTFYLDSVSLEEVAKIIKPYLLATKQILTNNSMNSEDCVVAFFSSARFADGRVIINKKQVERSFCVDLAVNELVKRGEKNVGRPWKFMATKLAANLAVYKSNLIDEERFRYSVDCYFSEILNVIMDFEKNIPTKISIRPIGLYYYQIIKSDNPFPFYSIRMALIDDKSSFKIEKKEINDTEIYKFSLWSSFIEAIFEDGLPYTQTCRLVMQKAICEKLGVEDKGITINNQLIKLQM